MLHIAQIETPQKADFAKLCAAYGIEHEIVQSWEILAARLNPLPKQGIRVLEIECDRALDAQWRREHLHLFSVQVVAK